MVLNRENIGSHSAYARTQETLRVFIDEYGQSRERERERERERGRERERDEMYIKKRLPVLFV